MGSILKTLLRATAACIFFANVVVVVLLGVWTFLNIFGFAWHWESVGMWAFFCGMLFIVYFGGAYEGISYERHGDMYVSVKHMIDNQES